MVKNKGWYIVGTNDGCEFGFKLEELAGFNTACTLRYDKEGGALPKQLTEYTLEMVFKGEQRLSVQRVCETTIDDIRNVLLGTANKQA